MDYLSVMSERGYRNFGFYKPTGDGLSAVDDYIFQLLRSGVKRITIRVYKPKTEDDR